MMDKRIVPAGRLDDLGDEARAIEGANTRPAGRVEHPETLTHYDPEHPYICAMYDLMDRG